MGVSTGPGGQVGLCVVVVERYAAQRNGCASIGTRIAAFNETY
jgi:hypothetical protein